MNKCQKIHLEEYLPNVINKFGYAILHADGNIYVDIDVNEKGEPVGPKHQPSYLAKEFASPGNEARTYSIKFTSVDQIPGTLEELESMFFASKAKEKAEKDKIVAGLGTLTMDAPKSKEPVESEETVQKKKPGRPKV